MSLRNIGGLSCISVGIFLMILGVIAFFYRYYTSTILITSISDISLPVIIGLGLYALGISVSSDERMKELVELNFVEKDAMMCGYLFDQTHNHEYYLRRIIRDLQASLKVVDRIPKNEILIKNNFINSLLELSQHILNHNREYFSTLQNRQEFIALLEAAKIIPERIGEIEIIQRTLHNLPLEEHAQQT